MKYVLFVELGLNLIVAVLKILVGWMTGSVMLVSDGIHSLSDGGSNIIGLVGVSLAAHPPDQDHPYGHRKFETIAAFIISFALFFASISILKEGIHRLIVPSDPPTVTTLSFLVMLVTLIANIFIALWERRKGKELKSDFLITDSWHTLSDCLVTLTVVVALIAVKFGWTQLDAIMSIGIAIFIGFVATKLLRNTSDVLADRVALDEALVKRVVKQFREVEVCHEIRSRGRIDYIHIDLHVLVRPDMTVEESHRLSHEIEDMLIQQISGVREVLVHVEPSHHEHGADV